MKAEIRLVITSGFNDLVQLSTYLEKRRSFWNTLDKLGVIECEFKVLDSTKKGGA